MALNLPVLTERSRDRYASQKGAIPTRLDVKTAKGKNDQAQLEQWKREVRHRDRMRCRVCGRKVRVCLELVEDRAECHHLEGRANRALRYDRRNGVLCCPRHHRDLQRKVITMHGCLNLPYTFELDGRRYLNADAVLRFL